MLVWQREKMEKVSLSRSPLRNPSELKKRYHKQYGILLKAPKQIAGIRAACQLSKKIMDKLCPLAKPGVTTEELSTFAHEEMLKAGATPATLGYGDPPYTKSICTSLNEVICHGIPGPRKLIEGDILNIDITCILNGYFGDMSRMVMVGKVSDERKKLVETAYQCLMRSIAILGPGVPIKQKSAAKSSNAPWENKCSVVYEFVGHGVESPSTSPLMCPTTSPISTSPSPGHDLYDRADDQPGRPLEAIIDPYDGWTATTADGKDSAQWEHTLLITPTGYEILTD